MALMRQGAVQSEGQQAQSVRAGPSTQGVLGQGLLSRPLGCLAPANSCRRLTDGAPGTAEAIHIRGPPRQPQLRARLDTGEGDGPRQTLAVWQTSICLCSVLHVLCKVSRPYTLSAVHPRSSILVIRKCIFTFLSMSITSRQIGSGGEFFFILKVCLKKLKQPF